MAYKLTFLLVNNFFRRDVRLYSILWGLLTAQSHVRSPMDKLNSDKYKNKSISYYNRYIVAPGCYSKSNFLYRLSWVI